MVLLNHEVILANKPSLETAQALTQKGFSQLDKGQPEAAFKIWQSAYRAYKQLNDKQGMTGSLINQSLALQAVGSYANACQTLTQALSLEDWICTNSLQKKIDFRKYSSDLKLILQKQPKQIINFIGFYNLANVLRLMGEPESSYTIIEYCLTFISELQNAKFHNNLLLNLANGT